MGSGLRNVALIARNNIDWSPGFSLTGTDQNLLVYTQEASDGPVGMGDGRTPLNGPSGDIFFYGDSALISLPEGNVDIHAARQLIINNSQSAKPPVTLQGKNLYLSAGQDVELGSNAMLRADETLKVRAGRHLNIYDSTVLKRLTNSTLLAIGLLAETGNLTCQGTAEHPVVIESSVLDMQARQGNLSLDNTNLLADYMLVKTRGENGSILIGNTNMTASQTLTLYAEGFNGLVRFVADSKLASPSARIAGNTVQVDAGVKVRIDNPNGFNVYSNNHNYNQGSYGDFTNNGGTPLNFVAPTSVGPHKDGFSARP